MATNRLQWRGLKELQAKIRRMEKGYFPLIYRATQKATLYVHSTVPPYPPPPPASTYVRTGTLGRSITTDVRVLGSQTVGIIGTNTVYAPWVISDERVGSRGPQARAHRGRWYTLQGVVRKARGTVVKIYREAVVRWLKM